MGRRSKNKVLRNFQNYNDPLISFVRDDHRFSLLHWASREGHSGIVEMLINRGARINATNMGDDTALHLAAAHGHRDIVMMVKTLLKPISCLPAKK